MLIVSLRFWTFSQLIIVFLLFLSSDLELILSNLGSYLELSFSNPGSDLESSFSNPGLFEFQVWNKPGIERLNSRSTLISPIFGHNRPVRVAHLPWQKYLKVCAQYSLILSRQLNRHIHKILFRVLNFVDFIGTFNYIYSFVYFC